MGEIPRGGSAGTPPAEPSEAPAFTRRVFPFRSYLDWQATALPRTPQSLTTRFCVMSGMGRNRTLAPACSSNVGTNVGTHVQGLRNSHADQIHKTLSWADSRSASCR